MANMFRGELEASQVFPYPDTLTDVRSMRFCWSILVQCLNFEYSIIAGTTGNYSDVRRSGNEILHG